MGKGCFLFSFPWLTLVTLLTERRLRNEMPAGKHTTSVSYKQHRLTVKAHKSKFLASESNKSTLRKNRILWV